MRANEHWQLPYIVHISEMTFIYTLHAQTDVNGTVLEIEKKINLLLCGVILTANLSEAEPSKKYP